MDLITVDITGRAARAAAARRLGRGDGRAMPIDDLADRAGTIGYEMLTRLGRALHRDLSRARR